MHDELINILKPLGKTLEKQRKVQKVSGKWEGTQFKSQADIYAHNYIVAELKKINSNIPIVSEEDISSYVIPETIKEYWLIDPIDGTASYAHGFDGYVTQIALIKDNMPVLSGIYAPAFDKFYYAEKEKGAYINNKKIKFKPGKKELLRLIDNYPEPRGIALDIYNDLNFREYIECGGISLKICRIAEESADLFFKDITARTWDVAAPQLFLEETGGYITDIYGNNISYKTNNKIKGLIVTANRKNNLDIAEWYNNKTLQGLK